MSRCRPFRSCISLALVFLIAALMTPAFPQVANPSSRDPGRPIDRKRPVSERVFTIQFKTVDSVYLLVSPLLGRRGSIGSRPHQRTLSVVDTPRNLARIAEAIAAFDVPPRAVEVAVQLILASSGEGSPEPTPPPIRGVIERLNALSTRWTDYRLVGNARVRGTEGEFSSLRVGEEYRVNFRIDGVSEESRIIRFKPFELERRDLTVEGNERYSRVMNTVLNLRESQLFIVGASKMEQSNRALFMTITASLETR